MTPFFSPDHSIDTLTNLVQNAQSLVDIATPSLSSWSGCTPYSPCGGCTPSAMRNESFPIFEALLNAVHRGVIIRILTNDYGDVDCPGKISAFPFMALNGIQVRYYTSTTFIHAKYMMADKKRAAVSSVNYSKTSFMQNREAGAVIEGPDSAGYINFLLQVFELDWSQAYPLVVEQTYSPSDMAIITDPTPVEVRIPPPPTPSSTRYVTPPPTPITAIGNTSIWTSPDFAMEVLFEKINQTRRTFEIMIYQITGDVLCQRIIDLFQRGIQVTILVSSSIYDASDCSQANICYQQLADAGLTIYITSTTYTYSHQKFWISDGAVVGWSTGNWSPSDFNVLTESNSTQIFPPYGAAGWQDANRDFHVYTDNPQVVQMFRTVMTQDLSFGSLLNVHKGVTCGSG